MEAEFARLSGKLHQAADLYEQAIRTAHEHEYVDCEALSNELAAKFYLDRKMEKIASAYLKNAHACYTQWGAMGKVKHLGRSYSHTSSFTAELQKTPAVSTSTTST